MKKMTGALIFKVDKILGPIVEKAWNVSGTETQERGPISKKELIRLFNLVYFEDIPKYIRFSSKKMIISRIKDSNAYFIGILDKRVSEKKALNMWYSMQRLMKQSVSEKEFMEQLEVRYFH